MLFSSLLEFTSAVITVVSVISGSVFLFVFVLSLCRILLWYYWFICLFLVIHFGVPICVRHNILFLSSPIFCLGIILLPIFIFLYYCPYNNNCFNLSFVQLFKKKCVRYIYILISRYTLVNNIHTMLYCSAIIDITSSIKMVRNRTLRYIGFFILTRWYRRLNWMPT